MRETVEYLKENVVLIGLSGAGGSGKDYLAKKYLVDRHGFLNFSLAWHFKVEACAQGLGDHEEVFHTKPPHIRTVLQIMGTELGRERYGENWWTNMTLSWIRHLHSEWGFEHWVIPDVRFPNEATAIRDCGGKVYRIVSDTPNRADKDGIKNHASETSLTDMTTQYYDGTIYNYIEHPRHNEEWLMNLNFDHIVEELQQKFIQESVVTTYGGTD